MSSINALIKENEDKLKSLEDDLKKNITDNIKNNIYKHKKYSRIYY
jgi:hypothetical protein